VKIDEFNSSVNTTTMNPKPMTDLTFLNSNQTTGNQYVVIDPSVLSLYPVGFQTKFVVGKNNWVLKANPAWNNFSADVPIVSGVTTIQMMPNGKFALV